MQQYYFYRYPCSRADKDLDLPIAEGYRLSVFTPRWLRTCPRGTHSRSFRCIAFVWWLMRLLGRFRQPEAYRIVTIHYAAALAHACVVLPWHRKYGFMEVGDFEVGPVNTDSAHRRKGLAKIAIARIKKDFAESRGCLWYLTRVENTGSIRLAENCGFHRYAIGIKRVPLGIKAFARYEIESVVV